MEISPASYRIFDKNQGSEDPDLKIMNLTKLTFFYIYLNSYNKYINLKKYT
jgi:hypothetical protein